MTLLLKARERRLAALDILKRREQNIFADRDLRPVRKARQAPVALPRAA